MEMTTQEKAPTEECDMRFDIRAELGSGTYGVVYKAIDR